MDIIFIRHGETDMGRADKHQHPSAALSEKGMKQVNTVAERLEGVRIDAIVSSEYERAIQTADILSERLDIPVSRHSNLFNEVKRPSEFVGKKIGTPIEREYMKLSVEHSGDARWHYSDEENYTEVKDRAVKAMEYLAGTRAERIAVVSHGIIIKFIIVIGIFGYDVDLTTLMKFHRSFAIDNTGITECRMDKGNIFKVFRFNDHSHLSKIP